jgi:hypothetical protein
VAVAAAAAAAVVIGALSPTFLEQTAFHLAAGLAASLVSTLLVIPAFVAGRLSRSATSQQEARTTNSGTPAESVHPLRRSA